jgi:hypothetical protein
MPTMKNTNSWKATLLQHIPFDFDLSLDRHADLSVLDHRAKSREAMDASRPRITT